jgi:hypothetical protein
MGFGGGGSGSFVLPNHDHTNVLADGGELLEATTLIDGITLAAWMSANSKMQLVESWTSTGGETSKVFTTDFDKSLHSEMIFILAAQAVAVGTFAPTFSFDSTVAAFYGRAYKNGVATTTSNAAAITLNPTFDGNGYSSFIELHITAVTHADCWWRSSSDTGQSVIYGGGSNSGPLNTEGIIRDFTFNFAALQSNSTIHQYARMI